MSAEPKNTITLRRTGQDGADPPINHLPPQAEKQSPCRQDESPRIRIADAELNRILDNTNQVFYSVDLRTGTLKTIGPSCERVFGFKPELLLDKPDLLESVIHPVDRRLVRTWIKASVAAGEPADTQYRIIRPDGETRWVRCCIFPVKGPCGKVVGLDFAVADITDQKQEPETSRHNETRLEAVLALDRMSTASVQEICDFTLRQAIILTESEVGFLAFVSEDGAALTIPSWSKSKGSERFIANRPLMCSVDSAGSWAAAVREARAVITNERVPPDLLKRGYPGDPGRIRRQISVPVFDDDRLVAVVGVANKGSDYAQQDVRQLTLLLEGLWSVMQRKQAREALEESERRYRLLIESMSEGLAVFDENCCVTYVNSRFCRMLEYQAAELVGRSAATFLDEVNQSVFYDHLARRKDGGHYPYEVNWTTKNGRRVPAIVSPQPFFDSAGNFVGSFAVVTDITTQKLAEEKLKATNDQLETEQAALKEKNIALKEVLSQIENEKRQVKRHIQANVDRILMPILRTLKGKADDNLKEYVKLLENCLIDIASPFINQLERQYSKLSPREIEICNMIKGGLSSKEIAASLDTSIHTVHNQRKLIRKKLGLADRAINLTSFLQTV